jgi:hypothetical protein
VAGIVNALIWTSETTLLVAGNLTFGENKTTILQFDYTKNEFTEIPGANNLPGPVTALTVANKNGDQLWATGTNVDGTAYLQRFDSSKWVSVDSSLFGSGTDIRGIQVLSLSAYGADQRYSFWSCIRCPLQRHHLSPFPSCYNIREHSRKLIRDLC